MGATLSGRMQPEELAVFKKLPQDSLLDNIEIPERSENRKPTDKAYLITFIVCAILLIPFLIYTLVYADINRLLGAFDNCGNVCGMKNAKYDEWSCTGQDFTDNKYLQYLDSSYSVTSTDKEHVITRRRECVHECHQGYSPFGTICVRREYKLDYSNELKVEDHEDDATLETGEVGDYLNKVGWRITLACFLSLGVALGMLYLFRQATAAMVWSILAASLVLLAIAVGSCWYLYVSTPDAKNKTGLLVLCIFVTIVFLVMTCIVLFLRKKVQLVIALLKEAMKAAFDMPQLMFLPILTFIAEMIIVILFLTTLVYMGTSGVLTEYKPGYLYYKKNVVMLFTYAFNIVITIWSLQFVVGLQYMVLAGAVAKWYFAKNKNYLDSPLMTSAYNAFRFHLGTVAFGSLIITITTIIRALITSAIKNKYVKAVADICLSAIEDFLKFLSKNAYIMTAMHGKPFYKSGKRAAKILYQNVINVVSINYISDFILGMAQLAIILISMLLTYAIMQGADTTHAWAVYVIVFIISLIVAVTFFSIFETVIDTLFLCFCEDSLLNDGMARPYAMSRNLMEFVDNAKKLFPDKKK